MDRIVNSESSRKLPDPKANGDHVLQADPQMRPQGSGFFDQKIGRKAAANAALRREAADIYGRRFWLEGVLLGGMASLLFPALVFWFAQELVDNPRSVGLWLVLGYVALVLFLVFRIWQGASGYMRMGLSKFWGWIGRLTGVVAGLSGIVGAINVVAVVHVTLLGLSGDSHYVLALFWTVLRLLGVVDPSMPADAKWN